MRYLFLPLLLLLCSTSLQAEEIDSHSMEVLLARSIQAIGNNKLDVALDEVDSLLKIKPNFKLAQLLKGDLLLARSQELDTFGNAPNAPKDRMEDLREEAIARLQRAHQKHPANAVPKFLWQLSADQHYALVVDTSKSTLYLYENVNGEPRYISDFYVTVGKKGADKESEGDQRTPLGVYFVESHLPKSQLADLYGDGAYPLNYPNEWDVRYHRNGHGIWLHGVPSDTYSRPPRASNGCVVLTNDDLLSVGKLLQIGHTPVIISSAMEWSNDADRANRQSLLDAIEKWRSDWSSLNTDAYLAHYAPDFETQNQKLADFAKQKRQVNAAKAWIKVKLSRLSMFPYPNQPGLVVVNFEQDYASSNLSNHMIKRQYWKKVDNKWLIVYEGTA